MTKYRCYQCKKWVTNLKHFPPIVVSVEGYYFWRLCSFRCVSVWASEQSPIEKAIKGVNNEH